MNEELSTTTDEAAGEKPTFQDVCNSLTGWEEIAIEQAADQSFTDLMNHQTILMRACAAVVDWRSQLKENPKAKYGPVFKDYMGRAQGSMDQVFSPEPKEDGLVEDESPAGKDDGPTETELKTLPPSVSSPELPPVSIPI